MSDFQQRKQIKKFFYSKVFLIILFIIVILLGRATYHMYQKYKMSSDDYAVVKKDYDSLEERYNMLDSEIDRLKTNTGVEEEIRSKFSVAKPGETVVTIINGTSSTSTDENNSGGGFWSSFLNIFSAKGGSTSGGK